MKSLYLFKPLVLVITLFLLSGVCSAQNTGKEDKHVIKVIAGLRLSDQINGGLLYKGDDFDNKSTFYNKALTIPVVSLSVGGKFKNLFQVFDFSYRSRSGFYDLGIGKDHINAKCLSYQVWYDFLNKKDFPIKPLVSISLAYANKIYSYESLTDKTSGTSTEFKDLSKTYMIQLPVGVYSHYEHFFVSFTCTFPVFAWIEGSFQEHQETYSHGQLRSTTYTQNDYRGNTASNDYKNQQSLFNLRIAYMFKLDNK